MRGLVINGVYIEWWKEKAQNAACLFELSECLLHRHPACLGKNAQLSTRHQFLRHVGDMKWSSKKNLIQPRKLRNEPSEIFNSMAMKHLLELNDD